MIISKILYELEKKFSDKNVPLVFRDYIKLAVIGMVLYYGEEYYDLIITSLDDINFYYGLDDVKNNSSLDIKQVQDKINNGESAFTLYNIIMSKKVYEGIPNVHIDYGICVKDNYNVNELLFLEFIVHELNHIICSKSNSLFIDESNNIGFRNGFYTAYLKANMQDNGKGRIFNEVINSLITEDIINVILSSDIPVLKELLKTFKSLNSTEYQSNGYSVLTTLFRPLFNVVDFKEFSKDCLMNGNILDMEMMFDSVVGEDKYDELLDKMDLFFEYYMKLIKGNKFTNSLPFDLSRIYIDLKDNYIKIFLEKKYNLAFVLK